MRSVLREETNMLNPTLSQKDFLRSKFVKLATLKNCCTYCTKILHSDHISRWASHFVFCSRVPESDLALYSDIGNRARGEETQTTARFALNDTLQKLKDRLDELRQELCLTVVCPTWLNLNPCTQSQLGIEVDERPRELRGTR